MRLNPYKPSTKWRVRKNDIASAKTQKDKNERKIEVECFLQRMKLGRGCWRIVNEGTRM